jgi:hypothetical protein
MGGDGNGKLVVNLATGSPRVGSEPSSGLDQRRQLMWARLVVALAVVAAALVTAATGIADPNLSNVLKHRHWIDTPAGSVQVGPNVCDNPSLQNAFNQFHNNAHRATDPAAIGPAAPGLNNGLGAEIRSTGC